MMRNGNVSSSSLLSSKQLEVNFYVKEIILEIINHGCYASFEVVLCILLERYEVSSFDQLNCGNMMEIKILSLLHELNMKVR